jgi:hypothetical protein
MAPDESKRSLQDVLRARRETPSLVTPGEAARRDAARRRESVGDAAAAALARFRDGRAPDGGGKLEPAVYRRLHELSPAAYAATGHWARRTRAQLAATPACEVVLCGAAVGLTALLLDEGAAGAEQPGRDLITLCTACRRRADRLGRRLGRAPGRPELAALDPRAPLYVPEEIAALKRRYAGSSARLASASQARASSTAANTRARTPDDSE